jgi:hypothetical protein
MISRTRPLTILLLTILVAALSALTPNVYAPTHPTLSTSDPPTGDFSVSCSPGSLTLTSGTAGSTSCTLTSVNSLSGRVRIQAFDDDQILSVNGTVGAAAGKIVTVAANGTSTFIVNVNSVTVAFPSGVPAFIFPVVIIATNDSAVPGYGFATLSHTFLLETVVNPVGGPNFPDYGMSLSTGSVSLVPGGSASPTITLTSLNSWAGSVNLGVSLSGSLFQTNAPALSFTGGTTLTSVGTFLTTASFTSTTTATLSITTTTSTPPGIYVVIIQANGGTSQPSVQHTIILPITVT